MISAGVVGGSGYAGQELIRILADHPAVGLEVVTSRVDEGKALGELNPGLTNSSDLHLTPTDNPDLENCDVVFFATPHGVAMQSAPKLLETKVKVIDLSPDFRLKDIQVWTQWYGLEHSAPDIVKKAVYGLPEINESQIKDASLVANPGCYATAVQLGFAPMVGLGEMDKLRLIADAKSGISGAGRGANKQNLYGEVAENFKAYGLGGHRHHPEILQGLKGLSESKDIDLLFVPHVMPAARGIFATLYARKLKRLDYQSIFEKWYYQSPFVKVLPAGIFPETRHVRGTNNCLISVNYQIGSGDLVILVVLDNLVKGASGQAVQNMNIMFGLSEKLGLQNSCLLP